MGYKTCPECHKGKCPNCYGSGKAAFSNINKAIFNEPLYCTVCHGTKRCWRCGGTRQVWVHEEEYRPKERKRKERRKGRSDDDYSGSYSGDGTNDEVPGAFIVVVLCAIAVGVVWFMIGVFKDMEAQRAYVRQLRKDHAEQQARQRGPVQKEEKRPFRKNKKN